jgi:hypothetical protein
MRGQYADTAYKCGLYHQLGKSLVPPEYQIWQSDFTDEERAVYEKYIDDGERLVSSLQVRTMSLRERKKNEKQGYPTKNIPWLMIREACKQHMERWDGSGYPAGLKGDEIGVIGQIVGLAKELDRLSAETKSESPFEEAYDLLISQSGTLWNPELILIFMAARKRCREVYEKYIHYTMTLPQTIPLVQKRPERPFGLTYRPMAGGKEDNIVAYEAIPWFKVTAEANTDYIPVEEVAPTLQRTNLVADVSFYMLYEVTDAIYRLQNCKIDTQGIVIEMLPNFYKLGSQLQKFNQLFEDQPIDKEKLFLTVPEETVAKASMAVSEILSRYLRNGIQLVIDGWHPEVVPAPRLHELGFTWVRPADELYFLQATANTIAQMKQDGFKFMGKADSIETMAWQFAAGVEFTGGTITGVTVSEDEMIRNALLKERMNYGT